MPLFVFNDWLIHDLSGEHGEQAQEQAKRLLRTVKERGDQLAFMDGSSWAKKTNDLMKKSQPLQREASIFLRNVILQDSNITVKIRLEQVAPLPQPLADALEVDAVHRKDKYLFQTYFTANADALITVDDKLILKVRAVENSGVTILHKDEFLREYLQSR